MFINIFRKARDKYLLDIKLIFFILCWLFLWLSINAKPSQLFGNGLELANGIRSLVPSILVLPLIYFCLKKFKINKFLISSTNTENTVFFLLIIYVFCKFLGGLHLYGETNFLEFNYLTYSFLSMILVILGYRNHKVKENFVIFISLISLFFLVILSIFYAFVSLKVYFIDPDFLFTKWMYAVHPITNEVLGTPYPRITGMSRIIAILCIVLFILFQISSKINTKTLLFIIFNFFSLIIWMMQSRGTLICFITTIFILIIFNNNLSYLKKILLTILLILIPTGLAELIFNYKFQNNLTKFNNQCIHEIDSNDKKESMCDTSNYTYSLNHKIVNDHFQFKKKPLDKNQTVNMKNDNNSNFESNNKFKIKSRLFKPHSHPTAGYTSGRTAIWEKIFKLYDYKKIFGLGAQGDRQILMGQESKFILSSNASNLIIYSFISSGYFGVISIFIICLILSLKVSKFFFENKNLFKEDNFLRLVGSSLLIFLLVRSLVENSFGVFSIDALLFVNAIVLFFSRFNLMIRNMSL